MTGYTKADDFGKIFDKVLDEMPKDKFVVYPDPQFTMEELIQHKQMSDEKERGVIFTPKVEEEGRIDEFPETNETTEDPNVSSILTPEEIAKFSPAPETNDDEAINSVDDDTDDLNKKTYLKITSTFYIKPAGTEKNTEGEEVKLYKILNPETNVVEKRQLTDIEKHDVIVNDLKKSKIRFNPIKHHIIKSTTVLTEELDVLGRKKKRKDSTILTNVTTNQFGADYRKKRKNKNRMAKASRKANR
jgi:hypothetical protein